VFLSIIFRLYGLAKQIEEIDTSRRSCYSNLGGAGLCSLTITVVNTE
jgi:hypothetical protein